MTTTRLTPWQSITLTDGERDIPATSARGIIALDEYRRTGSCRGTGPADTEELAGARRGGCSRRGAVRRCDRLDGPPDG